MITFGDLLTASDPARQLSKLTHTNMVARTYYKNESQLLHISAASWHEVQYLSVSFATLFLNFDLGFYQPFPPPLPPKLLPPLPPLLPKPPLLTVPTEVVDLPEGLLRIPALLGTR